MASNRFKIKQEWQEGGYRVVIDEHLDENSSNPVANWVLKQAIEQGGGGGGGGVWGTITGTITDQTDLIQYINAHGAGTWGAITGTLTNQTDLVQYINNQLTNYYTKTQVYTKAETDALIPTVNDATLTVQKNGTTVDTFTANASANKTINITVPTTAADVDALPDTTKYAASLTLSLNSTTYEMTATLKDQDGNTLGTAQTIDLPIESVVVSGRYDSTTKEVVLVLQSGSEIKFSVADLVSGLQPEITSSNKLSADLVDDTSTTHKFTTASDISKLAGIEANANNYVLPKATTSTLGGVKIGEHLEIDSDGVLETDDCVALYDPNDPQSQIPLIDTDMIVDGAITTDKIADEAVTEDKIDSDLLDNIAYVGSEVAGGTSQIQTTDIADEAITHDKIDWNDVFDYTGEMVVGKWFNGKPLYRKVIDVGNLPNATTKYVSTGLTGVVYRSLSGGALQVNDHSNFFPFNTVRPRDGISVSVGAFINQNRVAVETNTDRSGYYGYAIIEYTKESD